MSVKLIKSDIDVDGEVIANGVKLPGGGAATDVFYTNGSTGPIPGGAVTQFTLTDASTLAWDIATNPLAYLLATGAVGNIRTLPNSVLSGLNDGENYQLSFQQDATGGRSINFDTNFTVVGVFDLRADKISVITLIVQGGLGYAIISSWEGLPHNLSNIGTGEQILINNDLKSLKAGANITLTGSADEILIDAASGTTYTNAGAGNVLINGTTIKSLVAGTNVTMSNTATEVTINASGGGGTTLNYGTVYINSVVGNNTTGALNDSSKPFLTIAAAHTALPAFVNGTPDCWTIIFQTNGTYTYPTGAIPKRNLIYKSDHLIKITAAGAVTRGSNVASVYTHLEFNIPNGELSFPVQGTSWIEMGGSSLTLIARKFEVLGSVLDGGGFYAVSGPVYFRVQWARAIRYVLWTQSGASFYKSGGWSNVKDNSCYVWIGFAEAVGTSRNIEFVVLHPNTSAHKNRDVLIIEYFEIAAGNLFWVWATHVRLGSGEILAGWTGGYRPNIGNVYDDSCLEFVNSSIKGGGGYYAMVGSGIKSTITGTIEEITCDLGGSSFGYLFNVGGSTKVSNLFIRKATYLGTVATGGSATSKAVFMTSGSGDPTNHPGATTFNNVTVQEAVNCNGIFFDEADSSDAARRITMTGHNFLGVPAGFSAITSNTVSGGNHTVDLWGVLKSTGGITGGVVMDVKTLTTNLGV